MNFQVVRDRLVIEAETPAEGFWLRSVLKEITDLGFDCRNDVRGDCCKIQVPLRKQGELTDLDKASLQDFAERHT